MAKNKVKKEDDRKKEQWKQEGGIERIKSKTRQISNHYSTYN